MSDTWIALGLTLLCAFTRLLAVPASLWEWDDILFAKAMHRYDLAAHSPHPPGFPVFIVMARAAYALLRDEHSALVAVNLIFASMLGTALFYFYREVFDDRVIALAGALLGIFAPNVWIHSGAARSDGPALTLGITGLALVIRGLHSRRALLLGCAIFGLGMGVRVTLLPVMAPTLAFVLLARLRLRQWRLVAAAILITVVCVLCWYIPLVLHTTWRLYRLIVNQHAQYAFTVDAIFSPLQQSLAHRFQRFFMDVWGAPWIAGTVYALSLLGLLALAIRRRWQAVGWMVLAFPPFMIFTVVINTPLSAPLYSLPYIPFFIGLAASGIVMIPRLIFHTRRWYALENFGLVLAIGLALGMASWSYPIVKLLRSEASPPIRASRYLQATLDHKRDVLYYDGIFKPHVSFYLPDFRTYLRTETPEEDLINPTAARPRIYGLTDHPVLGVSSGRRFNWTPGAGARRLRTLSLGRYFDAYITDITDAQRVVFLSGWFQEESDGEQTWRWMSRRGKIALLGEAEMMMLRLRAVVASTAEHNNSPTIVLRLDGSEIDRFTADNNQVDRTIMVKTDHRRVWSTLIIETNQTIVPRGAGLGSDDRELGLQCFSLHWLAAAGAAPRIITADHFLGSGWYSLEGDNGNHWRWTSDQAVARLPPIEGDARLNMTILVPEQTDGARSTVTVEVAGQVVDSIRPPAGIFTKTYVVPASLHRAEQTQLTLSAKSVVSPVDQRQLAIQVFHLGWTPAEEH